MIARLFATVAGAIMLAAVAHVTISHTGGYGTDHALLTLAVAFGVVCGSVYCGLNGTRIAILTFSVFILGGEAYNFFQSANRLMAATEASQAPKREHAKAYAKAEEDVKRAEAALRNASKSQRLADAVKAKADADKAVTDKSAERGCAANCRQLLQAAVDSAAEEITKARAAIEADQLKAETNLKTAKAALDGMTAPVSATPFADRIGMAPWAFDVMVVALGSFAINGLACCLMIFGTHRPAAEPEEKTEPKKSTKPKAPIAEAATVVQVLLDVVKPGERRKRVEIEDIYRAYAAACEAQGVEVAPVESFGVQAKAFAEAANIRTLASDGKLYWCGVKLAA